MSSVKKLAVELAQIFNLSAKDIGDAYENDVETLEVLRDNVDKAEEGVKKNVLWTFLIPVLTLNPISIVISLGTSPVIAFASLWTGYKVYDNIQQKKGVGQALETKIQRHFETASAGDTADTTTVEPAAEEKPASNEYNGPEVK